jgi:hypothetical protein
MQAAETTVKVKHTYKFLVLLLVPAIHVSVHVPVCQR